MFLPPEGGTQLIERCTFDGTKSNYLSDQVNKWFVLKDLEFRIERMEECQTFYHFPTLTILWIRNPSFFPESYR